MTGLVACNEHRDIFAFGRNYLLIHRWWPLRHAQLPASRGVMLVKNTTG
jgi:hypothetical protein